MVTKAKKALLASLAAFLCVMLTVFGLSMSVSLSETAKAADETSAVAKVGTTTTYGTLKGAIDAAAEGSTVTLLKDTTEDVVVNKNITLDLDGKTLTGTNSGNATLTIAKGATATVKNGSVIGTSSFYNIQNNGTATFESLTATAGNTGSSMIDNWGTLTITSGEYTGGLNVVKSEEGSVLTISGGTFKRNSAPRLGITGTILVYGTTTITGGEFIDNTSSANARVLVTGVVKGYTAITKISGGKFTNKKANIFHWTSPATPDNFEISGGIFNKSIPYYICADGFIPAKNADGTYGVKPGKYIADVEGDGYETLAKAIAAAEDDDTVTLLDNINENIVIEADKNFTLDLNGYTINGGTGTDKAAITNHGTLTITDSSAAKAGTIKRDDKGVEGEKSYYVIRNLGTMTIEQANVINNSGYRKANPSGSMIGSSLICNGDNDEGATLTIKGGKLTQTNFLAIKNGANGTLFVNGGEITSSHSAVQNWFKAELTGGTIKGQLWTDAYKAGESVGNTKIGGNVQFEGEIVMDVWGSISPKPELTINGGKLSVTNWRITSACAELGGKPAVSGGTFTNAVPAEYCAEGFIPQDNGDGTFGVKEGAYVAKIGEAGYETLAEAIAAAKDGEAVKLLADIDLDEQIATGKAITIDGQGKYTIKAAKKLVGTDGKAGMFYRIQSAKGTLTFLNVTLDGNGVSKIFLNEGGAGETVFDGVTSVNGGGMAYGSGIHISGGGSHATIKNSTLTGSTGTMELTKANYYAANDLWVGGNVYVTVENSTIGTVFVNSAPSATATNGVVHGQLTITGENTKITYLSGEEESVGKVDKFGNNGSLVKIDSGSVDTIFDMGSYAISGGTFKTEIKPEYCADGFVATKNADGTFGVKVGTYVAEVKGVKYETLQAAFDAAKAGNTVTLLANTKENVTIAKKITLDLNGYTINGGTVKATPTILVSNCTVTITDSSKAKTGTVMREDTAENSGVSSHYVIDIQGKNGFLIVEGGNFVNNSGAGGTKGASLIRLGDDRVSAWPTLTIKGGTFTQDNFIVLKVDRGTLHFLGGTLNSAKSYAVENWNNAYIKGGTINGAVSSWVYSGGAAFSKLEISAGTINGNVESVSYDGSEDKQARVYITGGTVTGTLSNKVYSGSSEVTTAMATIEVTGGTFKENPSKYVVEESAIIKNENGTYGVEKAYLAKVGDTSYYTMDKAFHAAVATGGTLVLLRDYTTSSVQNSGSNSFTIDLNGHTWTCTSTDMNSAAFEINYADVTLTVKNGKIISNTLVGLIPTAMSGKILYSGSSLVFEEVEMTAKGHSGIETNGGNENVNVTLTNCTLNVPDGFGIYFPSSGTLTIENSTINAKTMGVQVCSGELNINAGSVITVTGDAVPKTENDGAIQDGAAISIVNRTGYKGLSNIVITGGTFTAKAGNDAIKAYDWNNAENKGSAFTKADLVAVSGGMFSSEVNKDYLADGFRLTKTGESYGVTAKYIKSTHVSLGTALSFSYKLRVLNEGEAIKNAKASYRTVRGNLVEIDMTLVDGYYVFDGITPQMLDRKISVNVYVGDTVVYDVVDYSILDYLQDLLKTDLGTKATVTKQLVADLAFYGKAAMKYVGYTTTVVDKFIADNGLTQSTGEMTGVATSSGAEKVAKVSVQFASQNKILIGVAESVFDDYSYTIKVNGTEIDKALWQTDVVDGYRVYVFDGFAARYITDKDHYVEVEVLKNGVSVQKVQCNVAGYCMKMAKNEKMGELATATYYYGVSAAEYANFKG